MYGFLTTVNRVAILNKRMLLDLKNMLKYGEESLLRDRAQKESAQRLETDGVKSAANFENQQMTSREQEGMALLHRNISSDKQPLYKGDISLNQKGITAIIEKCRLVWRDLQPLCHVAIFNEDPRSKPPGYFDPLISAAPVRAVRSGFLNGSFLNDEGI